MKGVKEIRHSKIIEVGRACPCREGHRTVKQDRCNPTDKNTNSSICNPDLKDKVSLVRKIRRYYEQRCVWCVCPAEKMCHNSTSPC